MELTVLTEQDVWPEFVPAVERFGGEWIAPSERLYRVDLAGQRLHVTLLLDDREPPPSGEEIDRDLYAFAGRVFDEVGGDWSAKALREVTALWGWEP